MNKDINHKHIHICIVVLGFDFYMYIYIYTCIYKFVTDRNAMYTGEQYMYIYMYSVYIYGIKHT